MTSLPSCQFPSFWRATFGGIVLTLLLGLPLPTKAAEFDLLIRGGRVVDGTGNPWRWADVAVQGDRIAAVARPGRLTAERQINAEGRLVCPGFVDIHSHSDFALLEDRRAESKIRQGVTTEILGEGNSAGPSTGQREPHRQRAGDQEYRWSTLGGYFDALEQHRIAVNVASYVGLGTVWRCVMGDRFDRPTEEELRAMELLVDQAMTEGALGLSSQVMMPPGSLATTDDLIRLCRVVARRGGIYSTHIRNEGQGVFTAVREAIQVGEQAGLPVDVIHLKIADQQYWGRMQEVIDLIQAARDRGVDVQANVYPYTRGNNNLASIIPPWAHEGGRSRLIERLQDPQQHARLKRDIREGIAGWYNHLLAVGSDWSRILVSGSSPYQGLTMDRVFALRTPGRESDPLDELFQMLIDEDGSIGAVYAHHTESDMTLALRQPWCSIGSDGSALAIEGVLRRGNPHPRNFGTFPRALGRFVREQKLLSWEEAIRKMTSLNAQKVGLRHRGLLAAGHFADITILDPEATRDRATYTQPFQYPEGIDWVIVNGDVVLEPNGRRTQAFPGRALRRTKLSP